jgi:hypothetical protein
LARYLGQRCGDGAECRFVPVRLAELKECGEPRAPECNRRRHEVAAPARLRTGKRGSWGAEPAHGEEARRHRGRHLTGPRHQVETTDARSNPRTARRHAGEPRSVSHAHSKRMAAAGLRTVGEVREASDEMLLSLPDLGQGSVEHLRKTLGLPSCDGVRPLGKKPPER